MSDNATASMYYGPVGESSSDILLEKTFMASGYLTGFGYGVQLVLYCMCTRALWNRKSRTRSTYFMLGYLFILNAMNTIWTGTSAYGLQLTFIDNRNYPGGPLGFLGVEFSLPVNVLSLSSLIAGNILADGLLLWRCYVIWTASLRNKAVIVMVIPILMLMGSFAMACLFGFESASPVGFFSKITASFALPYFALSLSLNILLTIMIVVQMWIQKIRGKAIFGEDYGSHYTSVSTMFVESAALYCICSILLLVTYAMNHPINQIWLGLSPAFQMTSSYLIIYRVVQGRAWTTETWNANGTQHATNFDAPYGQSDTRVAHPNSEGPIRLNPIDEKDNNSAQLAGIQVLSRTEVSSDKVSWKTQSVKEEV